MSPPQQSEITISTYQSDWPNQFEREADNLKNILGGHCIAVHHIGSTSVPGLCAKPALDILCIVDQLSSGYLLEQHDYLFKGEMNIPLHYFFSKGRSINLHMVEPNHGFIKLNLLFRDHLRTHPDDCLAYATLKKKLISDPKSHQIAQGRFKTYTLQKDEFIKSILKRAHFDGYALNFCLHNNEWATFHRILEQQIFDPIDVRYNPNHHTFNSPNYHHLILYYGTQIVTIARIELSSPTHAIFRSLATDTPYHGQGHASYMIDWVERWIKHTGRHIIQMHAYPHTESFYKKRGYVDMPFEDKSLAKVVVDLGKEL